MDKFYKTLENICMTDELSKKVINIFDKHYKNKKSDAKEKVKTFAGFSYVRMDEDANGYPFKAENLLEYAKSCHYIVKVMRERNGKTALYSYNIPSDKLADFIIMLNNNELNGSIIEIDKFIPKNII